MSTAPLLIALLLAPPPEAVDPADPWALRVGPQLHIESFDGPLELRREQPLTVGVRVDPYVPAAVSVFLLRKERSPAGDDDDPVPPRLKQLIGAETFPHRPPAGGDDPPTDPHRQPGLALVRLFPPEDGWPAGTGELRVMLDGFEDASIVRPARISRPLHLGGLLGFGPPAPPTPPPAPKEQPDNGVTIDANAAADALADDPNAAAATLLPNERYRLRGTFRAAAPEFGQLFGPELSSSVSGQGWWISNGVTRPFVEGDAAEDGTVLYWFRQVATAPTAPGVYQLEIEPEAFSPAPSAAASFPPLKIVVRPAVDADAGE